MTMDMMLEELIKEVAVAIEKSSSYPDQRPAMESILRRQGSEVLPILIWRSQNTDIPGSRFTYAEQFQDPKKMLYSQLEEVLLSASESLGAPLCIRANMGTILLPAASGLAYSVFDDAYPWLNEHAKKTDLASFSVERFLRHSIITDTVDWMKLAKELVPEAVNIYLPDTQGPFDLAHLLFGDQLFLEMYDDPVWVHEALDFSTELYIEATKLFKEAIDEPLTSCYHGHALIQGIHMDNGGVRISEDTATLLSPEQIDQFVLPYDKQALDAFGGGFIHYCGKNDYLLDAYLSLDGVRAINFGNPESHDRLKTMEKFEQAGCCCFGKWPKLPGESDKEYVSKLNEYKDHLILHVNREEFSGLDVEDIYRHFRDNGMER